MLGLQDNGVAESGGTLLSPIHSTAVKSNCRRWAGGLTLGCLLPGTCPLPQELSLCPVSAPGLADPAPRGKDSSPGSLLLSTSP